MKRSFQIKTIVKQSDSPCIITLNETNQLIGHTARAMEDMLQKGMVVMADGFMKGDDFLIEHLLIDRKSVRTGVKLNTYA